MPLSMWGVNYQIYRDTVLYQFVSVTIQYFSISQSLSQYNFNSIEFTSLQSV